MARIVFWGVSNMLSDLFDCALGLGHEVAAIVMNQPEVLRERTKSVERRMALLPRPPALVALDDFRPEPDMLHALGTTAAGRERLVELAAARHGIAFTALIHPTAYVSPMATIGAGVYVGPRSVIGPGSRLDDFVFVNRGVTVGHDTRLAAFARLQPGCNVGGHVTIGRGATVCIGAAVIEELVVGEGACVAAGAVVTEDVAPWMLVAGIPAKPVKTL